MNNVRFFCVSLAVSLGFGALAVAQDSNTSAEVKYYQSRDVFNYFYGHRIPIEPSTGHNFKECNTGMTRFVRDEDIVEAVLKVACNIPLTKVGFSLEDFNVKSASALVFGTTGQIYGAIEGVAVNDKGVVSGFIVKSFDGNAPALYAMPNKSMMAWSAEGNFKFVAEQAPVEVGTLLGPAAGDTPWYQVSELPTAKSALGVPGELFDASEFVKSPSYQKDFSISVPIVPWELK